MSAIEVEGDLLWANGLARADVNTIAESFAIHRIRHVDNAAFTLDGTLREPGFDDRLWLQQRALLMHSDALQTQAPQPMRD